MNFLENKIIDSVIGLRVRQKKWLKKNKELTGQSASSFIRGLIDKEIKKQERAKRKKQ